MLLNLTSWRKYCSLPALEFGISSPMHRLSQISAKGKIVNSLSCSLTAARNCSRARATLNPLLFACHKADFDVACLRIVALYSIIFVCVADAGSIGSTAILSVLQRCSRDLHGTATIFTGNCARMYTPSLSLFLDPMVYHSPSWTSLFVIMILLACTRARQYLRRRYYR
jgi:hypothetical protein